MDVRNLVFWGCCSGAGGGAKLGAGRGGGIDLRFPPPTPTPTLTRCTEYGCTGFDLTLALLTLLDPLVRFQTGAPGLSVLEGLELRLSSDS